MVNGDTKRLRKEIEKILGDKKLLLKIVIDKLPRECKERATVDELKETVCEEIRLVFIGRKLIDHNRVISIMESIITMKEIKGQENPMVSKEEIVSETEKVYGLSEEETLSILSQLAKGAQIFSPQKNNYRLVR